MNITGEDKTMKCIFCNNIVSWDDFSSGKKNVGIKDEICLTCSIKILSSLIVGLSGRIDRQNQIIKETQSQSFPFLKKIFSFMQDEKKDIDDGESWKK
jgi:hypothetical protein